MVLPQRWGMGGKRFFGLRLMKEIVERLRVEHARVVKVFEDTEASLREIKAEIKTIDAWLASLPDERPDHQLRRLMVRSAGSLILLGFHDEPGRCP